MASKIFIAAAFLAGALIVKFLLRLHNRRTRLKGFPMPPHSYLWGHLKLVGEIQASLPPNAHPHSYHNIIREKYNLPTVYYLDVWPFADQMLLLADPDANHQVTVQHPLGKPESTAQVVDPVTGEGSLVTISGPKWKMWRQIFNPGFSPAHLATLVPDMVDCCQKMARIMEEHVERRDIFQLEEAAMKVTVDIIGKVVLDVDLNAQSKQNELVTAFRSQLDWLPSFTELNPLKRLNPVRPFVFRRNTKIMDNYLIRVMSERFESRFSSTASTKPTKRSRPVIDIALDTFMQENRESQATFLSNSFMKGVLPHIKVFLFGGHDTSSSAICFTAYALSKYPSCLQKFRAECDEVFGSNHADAAQKIKDEPSILNRLPYTTAVIKESLRLWPPASSARKGEKDFFVNFQGQQLPTEETMTWVISHTVQHNPKFWPHAEKFLPERWLVKEGDPLFPVKGAYRPFEFGPRNCIGQELAMMEMKIVMVLLWRDFMIETAFDEWEEMHGGRREGGVKTMPDGDRAYQILVATAKPCDGMPVRMKRS